MPRTTKEAKSDDEKIVKKKTTAKSTTKKTTTAKNTETTKKTKTITAKKASTTKKTTATKKASTAKKTTATKKTSTTKKSTTTRKNTKKVKTATPEDFSIAEYYDLPYIYNETVVKVLAQTPNTLFVYWEISDDDRKKYREKYGENFFEITKPVLKIHNVSNNYSFDVDINDFANCWYLNINDSQCEYKIELGRKPIENKINTDYIYISSSNEIESPNNRILFDPNQKMAYFRNVKTNETSSKTISFSFMKNIGKIYNIYDLYKQIYKDENIEEYDLSNPSSKGNPSSTFK